MPSTLLHGFEDAWTSADPVLLGVTVVPDHVQGVASMQLAAASGASGVAATFTPVVPLDLSGADELRLWTYATRVADGSARRPFLLELSYVDANDAPGETHRWLVPAGAARSWEQHRFGIAGDRRSHVTSLRLTCLTDTPFTVRLDELLAVGEESLFDVEAALGALLDAIPLPGVSNLPVQPAANGATSLVVPLNRRLREGNRLAPSTTTARYAVTGVSHNQPGNTTTLTIQPPLAAAIGAGASLSVVAPVVFEEQPFTAPAEPPDLPDPVLMVTLTDQREEPERAWNVPQRDSFRVRGELTACSVRPPARPILAEYQILPAASDREHSMVLRAEIMRRVGVDTGLRVNGLVLPVRTLLPPPVDVRVRALPAPVYLHVGTRVETGPRTEVPWVKTGQILSGPVAGPFTPDRDGGEEPPVPGPEDQEGIVLRL